MILFPSVEVMTYGTVQKRAMAAWYVVHTSYEHPIDVGRCKSVLAES